MSLFPQAVQSKFVSDHGNGNYNYTLAIIQQKQPSTTCYGYQASGATACAGVINNTSDVVLMSTYSEDCRRTEPTSNDETTTAETTTTTTTTSCPEVQQRTTRNWYAVVVSVDTDVRFFNEALHSVVLERSILLPPAAARNGINYR